MYSAIVLAGGMSKKISPNHTAENEALIDVGGRPMIFYVLEALKKSRFIERILIVGPVGKLRQIGVDGEIKLVQSGSSLIDNIAEGIKAAATTNKVLLCTADIPLLTGEAVDHFIMRCQEEDADLYYPVVGKSIMETVYRQVERTYVKLSDGIFTGGNLFLVNPLIIPRCMHLAYQVIGNRKKPFKLASMLGWGYLLKLVLGRLSSQEAKQRAAEILKADICVIETKYAEIGMDVDKQKDMEVVKKYLDV